MEVETTTIAEEFERKLSLQDDSEPDREMDRALFQRVSPELRHQILRMLHDCSGVLAGSFVVCLYFPDWKPGDIDVFLPAGQLSKVRQLAEDFKWAEPRPQTTDDRYDSPCCVKVQRYYVHQSPSFSTWSINVVHYSSPDRTTLICDIRSSFDLDGCATIFTGTKIIPPPCESDDFLFGRWKIIGDDMLRVVREANTGSIPERRIRLKKCQKMIERLMKYQSRGIVVTNAVEVLLQILSTIR